MNDARGAIENLLYRYADAIDAGDYGAIGQLFARGVITDEHGRQAHRSANGVQASDSVAELHLHALTQAFSIEQDGHGVTSLSA